MEKITKEFLIKELLNATPGDIVNLEWRDGYGDYHSGKYRFISCEVKLMGKPYDIQVEYIQTGEIFRLELEMITRCEIIRKDLFPEPIHLLEKIGGKLVFDERAFYMYTGNTRHFNIIINGDIYECLFKKVNDVFSYCAEITCGLWREDKVYKGRLWNDQFRIEDISSNDIQSFEPKEFRIQTFSGDLIPFEDLFKNENVYKWNIELEIGEAYSLRLPNYENLVDGIFMGYDEHLDAIKFTIFDTDKSDTKVIDITKKMIEDGDCEVRQLALSYHRRDQRDC